MSLFHIFYEAGNMLTLPLSPNFCPIFWICSFYFCLCKASGRRWLCHDSVTLFQGIVATFNYWDYRFWHERVRYLGRFCGTNKPDTVIATGQITIHFKTDSSVQSKGFRAEYTSEGEIFVIFCCLCAVWFD